MAPPADRRQLDRLADDARSHEWPGVESWVLETMLLRFLGRKWDRSPESGATATRRVRLWLDFAQPRGIAPLRAETWDVDDFREWLQTPQATRPAYQDSTVKSVLSSLAKLLDHAGLRGLREPETWLANPFRRVNGEVPPPRQVGSASRQGCMGDTEVLALHERARTGPQPLGNTLAPLVVALLAGLGVRANELGKLDLEDVQFEEGDVARLDVGMKFNRRADRWLHPWVTRQLREYLRVRAEPKQQDDDRDPLLVHPAQLRAINSDDVGYLLTKARTEVGIPAHREVHARRFRQFWITRAQDHDCNDDHIAWAVGHSGSHPMKKRYTHTNSVMRRDLEPGLPVTATLVRNGREHGWHIPAELVAGEQCGCAPETLWVSCQPAGEQTFARAMLREVGTGSQPGVVQELGNPFCPGCLTRWNVPYGLGELLGDDTGSKRERVLDTIAMTARYPDAMRMRGMT